MEKNLKNIHRLIVVFIYIMTLASCSEHDCTYSYTSNFSHETITYKLKIKSEKNNLIYIYSNKNKDLKYLIKINKQTNSLSLIEKGLESKTIFLGSKKFESKDGEKEISCYLFDNPDLFGENLTILFNREIGVVINKYKSASSNLIKTDKDSVEIQKLVGLVKNDSIFMNLDVEYFKKNVSKKYRL
jgi:hypothetical protein